ncbi:somatostatin receptor type 5-like isoform X1 [Pseudophryne corroboree]|uniref:somatostatin receptor type 5-like isoform X1 n=1 Tax=Pseudophryne corroboree TaxID=495146 RepID=UPI00308209F0
METFPENTSMENFSFYYYEFNETVDVDYKYNVSKFFIPYLLVFAVGLIGNALVLYIVLRFRKMWTTSNIYMFSLALGDLFYMLCLLFFATEIASSYWPLGAFMCRLFWTLTTLTTFSSIYFLAVMSISVFIQLYFPAFSKKRCGLKAASLTSLVVWILCLLLGTPIFIHADMDEYNNCKIFWPNPVAFWKISVTSYTFTMAFLLPLTLILIFLILTALRARNQEKTTETDFDSLKENLVLIAVLCLVYVIVWLPTHVLEIISSTVYNFHIDEGVYYGVSLISYLKSCIYPILFGFLSQSFKEAFKKVLCCKKMQNGDSPHQHPPERQEEKSTIC